MDDRPAAAVLQDLAREAAAAFGARDCAIMRREGDDLLAYSSAHTDVRPTAHPLGRAAFNDPPDERLPSVEAMLTGQRVEIEDTRDYPGPAGFREAVNEAGIRAVLCTPIGMSQPIGVLNLGFAEPRRFSDRDRDLARRFASRAEALLNELVISDRERAVSERLEELEELRADFVTTLMHEIRTPLHSVRGLSDTLVTRWDGLEEQNRLDLARRVRDEAARLNKVVADLIETSGIMEAPLSIEVVDLGVEAARVLGKMEPILAGRSLEADVPTGLRVRGDRSACGRIMGEIVDNAVKFSSPETPIAVTAGREGDEVVVRVRDEGPGVPPEERERVFQRYYRLDRSASAPGGTGTGLYRARVLVNALGGRVWFEGEPGSWVTAFALPAADGSGSEDAEGLA